MGGLGADTFYFSDGDASDVLPRFERGSDQVNLESLELASIAQLQMLMTVQGANPVFQFAGLGINLTLTFSNITFTEFELSTNFLL